MAFPKDAMKKIQSNLSSLGFNPHGIDGVAGKNTRSAMQHFMRSKGFSTSVRSDKKSGMVIKFVADNAEILPSAVSDHPVPWMAIAYANIGLHEVADNAALQKFLRSDGETVGDPKRVPWCADFTQTVITNALPLEPFEGRMEKNPYLAYNWLDFGRTLATPSVGALMVFWRGNKSSIYGHIGFYVGEDTQSYYILGGNQKNKVSITRISKGRLRPHGIRWPVTSIVEPTGRKIINDPSILLSVNEA
jgi:uncharacterized protein (TIGR02594 family)